MNSIIFAVVQLIGGLAFFLYGMNEMSGGLKKISGGKLEKTLRKMTDTPVKGMALGAAITVAIQSSSAMTVTLVGLVNSGILQLSETVGVIMGSNIGTTLTAWILSLSGIKGGSIFVEFLKPDNFAPIVALIGISLIMISKRTKRRDMGAVLVGFAILMTGMSLMSDAVKPLSEMPQFQSVLTAFNDPFIGLLVGTLFTGIIQSSAASIGILQALSLSGGITYNMAVPIILGQNIGTCVTALISSIGVNKNAKRVSILHVGINVIGAVICMALFYGVNAIYPLSIIEKEVGPVEIAVVHSIFNLFTTLILFPFSKLLVKLTEKVIPDREEKESFAFIDERLLNTPSLAIFECNNLTVEMSKLAHETVLEAMDITNNYSAAAAEKITEKEDRIDIYEDKLGTYLVKIASKELTESDSRQISKMLHTIGQFERLGDHACNLLKTAEEMNDKEIKFSDEATREIEIASAAITEIMDITMTAFEKDDVLLAKQVEPLEQVIDEIIAGIRSRHITRLKNGTCTIELGFVLSDLLSNYERVSDHCSNIAVAVIEAENDKFEAHEYLSGVKNDNNEEFNTQFKAYSEKYCL